MQQEVKDVTVLRDQSEKDWTLSEFHFNGSRRGFGCEDEKREVKVKGETRIPNGTYFLGLRISPKFSEEYYRDEDGYIIRRIDRNTPELKARYAFPHELIWVKDVPNFDKILWHWGNIDDDTDGCYLVGSAFGIVKGQRGVINSRGKYTEIYPILWRSIRAAEKAGIKIPITYKDK